MTSRRTSTRPARQGLTLVELIASLALLSLVAGACISWITSVSRSALPTIEASIEARNVDRAMLLLDAIVLRSTDERVPEITSDDYLLLPSRWSVLDRWNDPELAHWVLDQHARHEQVVSLEFLGEDKQQLGKSRPLLRRVADVQLERVVGADGRQQIQLVIMAEEGIKRVLSWSLEVEE